MPPLAAQTPRHGGAGLWWSSGPAGQAAALPWLAHGLAAISAAGASQLGSSGFGPQPDSHGPPGPLASRFRHWISTASPNWTTGDWSRRRRDGFSTLD
ncbi:hypothetical protein WCLP8_4890004 [uncultured Gammaproteobacteria bacterium]